MITYYSKGWTQTNKKNSKALIGKWDKIQIDTQEKYNSIMK